MTRTQIVVGRVLTTNTFVRAWAFMLIVGILEHHRLLHATLGYWVSLLVMFLAAFVLDDRETHLDGLR